MFLISTYPLPPTLELGTLVLYSLPRPPRPLPTKLRPKSHAFEAVIEEGESGMGGPASKGKLGPGGDGEGTAAGAQEQPRPAVDR